MNFENDAVPRLGTGGPEENQVDGSIVPGEGLSKVRLFIRAAKAELANKTKPGMDENPFDNVDLAELDSLIEGAPKEIADIEHETLVRERLNYRRADDAARRLLHQEQSVNTWSEPSNTGRLSDMFRRTRVEQPMLVDNIIGREHNISIAGQYKTGKTVLTINLAWKLVDSEPFLGCATHLPSGETVGWWNGEMSEDDFVFTYAQPMGIKNTDRIEVAHLRGARVDILSDAGRHWAVEWLKANGVGVWVVDSWRVLCSWAGVHENDNTGGGQLLAAIDEIKAEAGVKVFVVVAHTGRGQQEHGQEHARGMTALDDWVDARWVMTKQKNGQRVDRYLAVTGRLRGLDETKLIHDETMNRIDLGEGDRKSKTVEVNPVDGAVVVDILTKNPGINTTELKNRIASRLLIKHGEDQVALVYALQDSGLIHMKPGKGQAKLWFAGPDPENVAHKQLAQNLISGASQVQI